MTRVRTPVFDFDRSAERLRPLLAGAGAGRLTAASVIALREAAAFHGVLPLLAHRAIACDPHALPEHRQALARVLADAATRETLQRAEACRAVEALGLAGVRVVLLKGAHTGPAFYEHAYLRPRSDLDLLVAPGARAAAGAALERDGWTLVPHVRGDAILQQMHFLRSAAGVRHAVDLHWHAVNPLPFRHLLPFDGAWQDSEPAPSYGPHARALRTDAALLLAAAHLAAHHRNEVRLIWLSDVDRIAARLDDAAWDAFVERARAARVAAIAVAVLDAARTFFDTAVPPRVRVALESPSADERLTAAYLRRRSRAGQLWIELRAAREWRVRAAMLWQHLVPEPAYMRGKYGARGAGLIWTYVHRAAAGARAWLRRPV